MKVEIWSDMVCPFCYIGKRKFEKALSEFADKDQVEIVWRSYQLDPSVQYVPGLTVDEYLAENKGLTIQQAKEMNDYVTDMAKEIGLEYDFSKAIIANTFDAHRLIHLAKKHGLQDKAEERLFAAYFTEGKNLQDKEVLIQLGTEVGLDADEIRQVLGSDELINEVRKDFSEAHQIGVRGVPFFVFNKKYAVSGAQSSSVFLQTLEKAAEEEIQVISTAGNTCSADGECN